MGLYMKKDFVLDDAPRFKFVDGKFLAHTWSPDVETIEAYFLPPRSAKDKNRIIQELIDELYPGV